MNYKIFFAPIGGGVFNIAFNLNSWIVYDQYVNRFVLAALATDSLTIPSTIYIFLAISKASIFPTYTVNDWYMYRLDGGLDISSLRLGYDMSAYYLTMNDNINGGSNLIALQKTQLLNGMTPNILFDQNSNSFAPGFTHHNIFPVQSFGTVNAMYFIEAKSLPLNTETYIFTMTNVLTSPTIVVKQVNINSYAYPFNRVPAPVCLLGANPLLFSNGDIFNSAVVRNQKLWASHNTAGVNPNLTAVRWYCFDLSSYTVIQQEIIVPPLADDNCWTSSIAVDDCENMGLCLSISSTSRNPSIAYTGKSFLDNTTRPLKIAKIGPSSFGRPGADPLNYWGSYCGLKLDCVDGRTFWLYHEYPNNGDCSTQQLQWATFNASFKMGCCNLLSKYYPDLTSCKHY